MDSKKKLESITRKLKIHAESKKKPDDYKHKKHDYRKAQAIDGGTIFGTRYFNLRVCRVKTCLRVEVSGGTYERDKNLPLVKGVSFTATKDEGCNGSN